MKYRAHVIADRADEELTTMAEACAIATLEYESAPQGELSVAFVDNDRMQAFNRQFRGDDKPTDVLSFSDGSRDPDTDELYFGDVILGLTVAEAQAAAAGHPLKSEIALLTVHGVLHLLGYDHDSEATKQTMWQAQSDILHRLNVNLKHPA
jgi:probable rRNA maturation factor